MPRPHSDDEYVTAATGAQSLVSNHNLPMLDPHSDTCFSNVRWNTALVYNAASVLVLYQTVDSRRWAAVEASAEGTGMFYSTYLGIGSHASAALFSGMHPAYSTSWRRHNVLYAPYIERDASAVIMHIGAAVGIMSKQGDVGDQRSPLRPVTAVYAREAAFESKPITVYRLAAEEEAGLAVTTTVHLRDDTTSTAAFRVPDLQSAQVYLRPDAPMPSWPAGCIDLSMFGRPTSVFQKHIQQLLASAAYVLQPDMPC